MVWASEYVYHLVGNIDAKEAIPMIRDKFERVPRRAEIHREKKPVRQFKGRTEKSAKIFYYPMLALIYNGVPSNDKDEIALEICCQLLSNSQKPVSSTSCNSTATS